MYLHYIPELSSRSIFHFALKMENGKLKWVLGSHISFSIVHLSTDNGSNGIYTDLSVNNVAGDVM